MPTDERNPADPKDIRPFHIERGFPGSTAWLLWLTLADELHLVGRHAQYDDVVAALVPMFVPERRLLGRIAELEACYTKARACLDAEVLRANAAEARVAELGAVARAAHTFVEDLEPGNGQVPFDALVAALREAPTDAD